MAKNTMNVVAATQKQQVSKILMGQIMSGLKYTIMYSHDHIEDTIEYKLLTSSAYTDRRTTGWESDNFSFRFEYGKHHGSVRVSYMNSDGLQSAVFSADEWRCFTSYMLNKIDRMVREQHQKRMEQAAREKAELERRKFEAAVRDQVEKVLAEKLQQGKHINNPGLVEFDDLDDFKTI